MLPILYRFTFETTAAQLMLYILGLAIIAWAARNGFTAPTVSSGAPPTLEQRRSRAISSALIATAVVVFGWYYAMPSVVLLGEGKNQGIPLYSYGILIGCGFLSAVSASASVAAREWPGALGQTRREQVFDLAFYVFAGGIVGAKALFTLVNWKQYADHPSDIFSLNGGLVFQGALLGSAAVAYWYCRTRGIEFLRLLDFGLPAVSLGAAFGRLGCFAAGCCWGKVRPLGSLLAVRFPGMGSVRNILGQLGDTPSIAFSSMSSGAQETRHFLESTGDIVSASTPGAVRLSEWVASHHHTPLVHPVQLYESFLQLSLFVAFMWLRNYRRFHGQIAALWLSVYAVERTVVETFRGDAERGTLHGFFEQRGMGGVVSADAWYNFSTSQVGSALIFAAGLAMLVVLSRRARASETPLSA
jgi:phosphatidylglycerol---prolipoprotein diacylglyceryl transferase